MKKTRILDLNETTDRVVISVVLTTILFYLFWVIMSGVFSEHPRCMGFAHGFSDCTVGEVFIYEAQVLIFRLIFFGSIYYIPPLAIIYLLLTYFFKHKNKSKGK